MPKSIVGCWNLHLVFGDFHLLKLKPQTWWFPPVKTDFDRVSSLVWTDGFLAKFILGTFVWLSSICQQGFTIPSTAITGAMWRKGVFHHQQPSIVWWRRNSRDTVCFFLLFYHSLCPWWKIFGSCRMLTFSLMLLSLFMQRILHMCRRYLYAASCQNYMLGGPLMTDLNTSPILQTMNFTHHFVS